MTANFHRLNDIVAEIDNLLIEIDLSGGRALEVPDRNPLTITDTDVARFEALRDALTAALAQFTGEGQ